MNSEDTKELAHFNKISAFKSGKSEKHNKYENLYIKIAVRANGFHTSLVIA